MKREQCQRKGRKEKGTMSNAYDVANNAERDIGPPFAFTVSMTWLEGNECLLEEAAGCRGVEVVEAVENKGEKLDEVADTINQLRSHMARKYIFLWDQSRRNGARLVLKVT
jgi:hypothetical protein